MKPLFIDAQINVVPPTEPIEVKISGNARCMRGKSASYVRHIEFDLAGTALAGTFVPGQSIGVRPVGEDAEGRPHGIRFYSISSPTIGEDGEGQVVSTTCKRLIDEFVPEDGGPPAPANGLHLGVCSNYLCSLASGESVWVTGPVGKKFLLPSAPDEHDYLFMATGTGIAPFRGMIKDLLYGPNGPTSSQIHLVMGVPYTSDLLYDDFLQAAASEHANFHYHPVMSREPETQDTAPGYVHDYVARTPVLAQALLSNPRTLLYLCGLKGMQIGIFRYLVEQGQAENFLRIPRRLAGTDPAEWTAQDISRLRPEARCMVEVY